MLSILIIMPLPNKETVVNGPLNIQDQIALILSEKEYCRRNISYRINKMAQEADKWVLCVDLFALVTRAIILAKLRRKTSLHGSGHYVHPVRD